MEIQKIAKKQFNILFLALFSIATTLLQIVIGAPLSDTNDILIVDEPRANSVLTNSATLRFKLYDDDNSYPFYDAGLFRTDCVTKVATIVSNDHSIKTSDNIYTKNWNTDGPFLDVATLSDGQYCLKICVDFSNDGSSYSVCDMRYVTLSKDINHSPIIVSELGNANYLIGQSFRYDVDATDEDGDILVYELVNSPTFLTINTTTGEISSINELNEAGSFSAIVRVSDQKGGGVATQQFSFVVNEDTTQQIPSITIISPRGDTLYSDDLENIIKWSLENISDISKINIYYSRDGNNWVLIESFDDGSIREYKWELPDEVQSGDYFVKLEVVDQDNKSYSAISDKFSIASTQDQNIEYTANITDVTPPENADIEQLEQIRAKLIVSKSDAEVNTDSINVKIDDNDISKSCELLADNMLVCDVSGDNFENGKHKVEISFRDTNNVSASKLWHFNLQVSGEKDVSSTDTDTRSIWAIIALVCIILSILILVPWFLYLLWKRRSEGYDEYDQSGEYNNDEYYDAENDLDDYYFEPQEQEQNTQIGQEPANMNNLESFDEEEEDDDFIGEASLADALEQKGQKTKIVKEEGDNLNEGKDSLNFDQNNDGLLDENDIPDWLKSDNNSSTPLTPTGNKMKTTPNDKNKDNGSNGSEVFEDYGLATKD